MKAFGVLRAFTEENKDKNILQGYMRYRKRS